jgi:hypothetical protein
MSILLVSNKYRVLERISNPIVYIIDSADHEPFKPYERPPRELRDALVAVRGPLLRAH